MENLASFAYAHMVAVWHKIKSPYLRSGSWKYTPFQSVSMTLFMKIYTLFVVNEGLNFRINISFWGKAITQGNDIFFLLKFFFF